MFKAIFSRMHRCAAAFSAYKALRVRLFGRQFRKKNPERAFRLYGQIAPHPICHACKLNGESELLPLSVYG